ncbi:MAG: tyrosine-type recombinase/integrase, partial [Acidobacteriia bacterium]|nr:tyrosine-type recombinase/integrase [Terriglobia bacterium]
VPAELVLPRLVLVDTGLRCGELCEANVGDLKDVAGAVYLTLRVKGRRQAGSQPVSVPLSATCAASVKAAIAARGPLDPGAPLFTDRHGRRFSRSQMTTAMIRLGQRAGITRVSTSPHKLRHTANVIARLSGVDPLTRAAMLNHRSLKTLARYDHLVPGEVAKGREAQRQGLAVYLAQGRPMQSIQVVSGNCETGASAVGENVNEIAPQVERVPCVSPRDNYSI